MQVVWFNRDLRVADHPPLTQAAMAGRCICLYVYETELITSPEFDASHLEFINRSLAELDRKLRSLGGRLTRRCGRMPDVLDDSHREFGIDAIWSHVETGTKLTFDRDERVRAWAGSQNVPWNELPQNGVIRGLNSRDGWSRSWNTSKILRRLDRRPDVDNVRLVTHSMGGIVARFALLETRPEKVTQLIMLGPPNRGSRVASILSQGLGWLCKPLSQLSDTHDSFVNQLPPTENVEIGIIAALYDRVVAIDSTRLSTQKDHLVVASGHSSMLFRCDVANRVANFLQGGRFGTPSSEGHVAKRSAGGAECIANYADFEDGKRVIANSDISVMDVNARKLPVRGIR